MAITNAQLNAYITTLSRVDTAIVRTIEGIRALELVSESIGGSMGTSLLPLENQITGLEVRLRSLYSMKNQLMSAPPTASTGTLPFSRFNPKVQTPNAAAMGTEIVPYSGRNLTQEAQRLAAIQQLQKEYLASAIVQRRYNEALQRLTTTVNSSTSISTQRTSTPSNFQYNFTPEQQVEFSRVTKSIEKTTDASYEWENRSPNPASKEYAAWAKQADILNAKLNELYAAQERIFNAAERVSTTSIPATTTAIEQQIRNAGIDPALQADLTRVNVTERMQSAQREISNVWEQAQRENAIFNEYTTNPRYTRSRDYAASAGYKGIPNVTQIGTSGVQQLDWRQNNERTGMSEKLRLFNTPSGGNIESTSRKFQTLTSAIGRDIRELTKWSIAIAIIYGPLNAVKQLMADMVENETRLANAMIAVSDTTLRVGEVFNIAKAAADELGTGVSDTINSFTMAYRATGNLGSSFERITTGTQLLKDSLVLAKLSGMEEATAIDTLAASLRQTNTPLDEGTSLLDKWVKTTQVANVDLETLSTGFAVLGDAAETAGMSIDELNGLLAAIAETGVASGKEVANTAKAIVSGFYSDKSVAQLNKLGIATKDAEGNLRDFNSIATELYQQRQLGLISDTAFQDTARAIGGGGNRRQAAVTTLIENYARVQQVAALSATANGEAQEAMGRRLDTVQTASTRLNNAFQSLAQSLGNEGGLLDLFGLTLEVVTGITSGFDALISVMGKAGPMLMTLTAGSLILKSQGPLAASSMSKGIDSLLMGVPGYANTGRTLGQAPGGTYEGTMGMNFAGGRMVNNLLSSTPNLTNLIGGGILTGISAIQNLSNKEDPHRAAKAAANIIGAAGGAIASTLLGMSPIIGMSIGSAIGEAFVTTATYDGSIARILSETGASGYKVTPPTEYTPDAGTEGLFKEIGLGSAGLGKVISWIFNIPGAISGKSSTETAAWSMVQATSDVHGPESGAAKALAAYNKTIEAYKLANPEQFNIPPHKLELTQQEYMGTSGSMLTEMRKQAEAKILTQLQQGDITSADYTRKRESLSTFEGQATKFASTFGNQLIGNVPGINSMADAYQVFLNIVSEGTPEALDAITQMSSEIFDSKNAIEDLSTLSAGLDDIIDYKGDATHTKGYWIDKLTERIIFLESVLPAVITEGNKAAQSGLVSMPTIVNANEPYSRTDLNKITAESKATEFAALKQLNPDRTDVEIQAYLDSQDEFGVYVEEFGKAVYMLQGGTSEGWFKQTANKLAEEGLINTGSTATKAISPQMLDINSSQFPLLQQYTNQAMVALKTIPGFTPKEESLQVFGKDWIGGVIHGDQLALRLALEKLIGIQEKQLDGIYNLPDGSFFTAFLTPEWMALMPKGGGGGGGGLVGGGGETTTITPNGQPFSPNTNIMSPYRASELGDTPIVPSALGGSVKSGIGDYFYARPTKGRKTPGIKTPNGDDSYLLNSDTIPTIYNWLNSLPKLLGMGMNKVGTGTGFGAGIGSIPSIPKIGLNLNTTTTVQLDGRVIASIIKIYLAEDLARMTVGYGKSAKDYIV